MILQTKIRYPALPSGYRARPRLERLLDVPRRVRLTLVAAPAGFGKTSLVAAWAAAPGQRAVAWLTLDAYDDDPNRFWRYVAAALESLAPTLGAALQTDLARSRLPPLPELLAPLLNHLTATAQPLVLVLDDYHHMEMRAIHQGVAYLIQHAPPTLRLVLITRADPPLALARLRAQGLLTEIRAQDLRFTAAEATAFLHDHAGLTLTDAELHTLMARTEGWPAGLRLLVHTVDGRRDARTFIADLGRTQRFIVDYLTEEVVQQQPEDVRRFLEETSILSALSAPLCDAVTGRSDTGVLLARLHAADLFVTPLDDAGHWFGYHPLLADLLRARLRQRSASAHVQALHRRAGHWYAAQQAWEPALDHAVQADDWEWTADLVAEAYAPLLAQGQVITWQRWFEKLPHALRRARPLLQMRRGWTAFLGGDVAQAELLLDAARVGLSGLSAPADAPAGTPDPAAELAGYLATLAFFRAEPARIVRLAQEALALAPPHDLAGRSRATAALGVGVSLAGDTAQAMDLFADATTLARAAGNPFLLAHSLELVADGQIHTGQLHAAAQTCRTIIAQAEDAPAAPRPFAANGHVKLAAVLTEQGALEEATAELTAAHALVNTGGIGYNGLDALCVQIRLAHARGDVAAAYQALHTAQAMVQAGRSAIMRVQLAVVAVPFWLQQGDLSAAEIWLASPFHDEGFPPLPVVVEEVRQVWMARVDLAQARPEAALAASARVAGPAEVAGRVARVIEFGLVDALAYAQMGDQERARHALAQVLTLAEPSGYCRLFVDAGPPLARLLATIPPAHQSAYVHKLIRDCAASAADPQQALVEPLSVRELDVLRLIAAGLSNQQIAAELFVSLNTVKKHTSHIYGKLGVRGRTQAVARAQALRLL